MVTSSVRLAAAASAACLMLLQGCSATSADPAHDAQEFLRMYNAVDQQLWTAASNAQWRASTDVTEQNTGARAGADSAMAAFRGSRYVIDNARKYLTLRQSLSDLEFRQLDKVLLNAAESPGTIPDVVQARVLAEARAAAALDGFTFCLNGAGPKCAAPVTPNQIDAVLRDSRDLAQRRRYWDISKQSGPALKNHLVQLRDLRNRVAREMGYSSFFGLQVADYGMSVTEMMQLMDKTVADMSPLYEEMLKYARRTLAARYKQPVPAEHIPAHWVGNRWAQEWPGMAEGVNIDPYFKGRTPEWVVQQAEKFYVSLGMPALPKSFWDKSDLYALPAGATRKKNAHASAWHIDRSKDVRSLMSVAPDSYWFETTHHELGHVYYYIAYSNDSVPPVLREGANRAFHEAVGDLISIAARQEPYLRQVGILPASAKLDPMQYLLEEAFSTVVFLPWSAGTMTHFEHDLYEKNLPPNQFNARWWEAAAKYQKIAPPAPRGEEFCDACTKTHIIDDSAQYYDYAMAFLIKYQLHDHIARKILRQDPHSCNYYGNKEVGKWLTEILSLGATRDWRAVIKDKTGEEISSRAILEYFKPVEEHLKKLNAAAAVTPAK
ncbi:MAG: M2 family metallopeptidase [Bryobacterales bacterium]|nr:M2 family metallopeptidase [Bryobacterales bacterium]